MTQHRVVAPSPHRVAATVVHHPFATTSSRGASKSREQCSRRLSDILSTGRISASLSAGLTEEESAVQKTNQLQALRSPHALILLAVSQVNMRHDRGSTATSEAAPVPEVARIPQTHGSPDPRLSALTALSMHGRNTSVYSGTGTLPLQSCH